MRCPKCHYLSFEPEPRCKNCGYDLALGPSDVLIKPPEGPLSDFELRAAGETSKPSRPLAEAPRAQRVLAAEPPRPAPATTELPLFLQGLPQRAESDEPLVKVPREPRVPLSVRRQTPAAGRVREKYQGHRESEAQPQPGLLERDLLGLEAEAVPAAIAPSVSAPLWVLEPAFERVLPEQHQRQPVGAARRLEAAAIDVLFVGGINVVVIWLTLLSCDLTARQALLLPILPLAAFLFLVDGGYLLMFTATLGQTVGKMAAGIRVVGTSAEPATNDRVTFGQAALRSLVTFPSVLALGAGFFPALSGDGRAVHDRIAHTRVIRA
jgi:uncharacterized RDD family membrane protein YckC